MRSFIICTLHLIFYDDQTEEDNMGGICSTHGKMRKHTEFLSENLKKGSHVEDLDLDGRIISKLIFKK
jgi:hypothetical protein